MDSILLRLSNSPKTISPKDFEDAISYLFERDGYSTKQTPYSKDRGFDIIVYKYGKKYLIECKRYTKGNKIGRPELQRFYGAVKSERAIGGFFVTTSEFTKDAIEFANKMKIELIDYIELKNRLKNITITKRIIGPGKEDIDNQSDKNRKKILFCPKCKEKPPIPISALSFKRYEAGLCPICESKLIYRK